MSLTIQQLNHLSKLCSLNIKEEEKEKFLWQIDSIIWFVSQLQNVDVDWIEPLSHPIEWMYMEMNEWIKNSNFSEDFLTNVKHDIKDNWIVIKSAIK